MAGVAFMTVGFYCGYRSMHAAGGRAATAWLAAASLGFGLASGCRLNLMPTAVALAVVATLWRWWQIRSQGPARLAATGVAGLVPAGAVMLGLLVINKLRFDAWTEFGRDYVMTYPLFVPGLRFLIPDTYAYAFAPPQWSCTFPYLSLAWNAMRPLTPAWLPVTWPADHFTSEPTLGLLTIAPFFWFAMLAPLIAIARARLMLAADPARPGRWAALLAAPGNWLWAALVIYLLGSVPLLILNVTTMRYEHDFATGLLLIAIFASWKALAAPLAPRRASRDRVALRAAGGGDDRRGPAARLHRLLQALRTPQPRPPPHPGEEAQRVPDDDVSAARGRRSRAGRAPRTSRAGRARRAPRAPRRRHRPPPAGPSAIRTSRRR